MRDTAIRVTVACPALVRTGMSDVGADPMDVAQDMIDAARQGIFVLTDPAWRQALVTRWAALAAGDQPVPPMPDPHR